MRESTFSPSFPICSPSPMVVEVVVVEEVVEVPPRFRKSVRLGIVYPYLRDEKTTF